MIINSVAVVMVTVNERQNRPISIDMFIGIAIQKNGKWNGFYQ